MITLKESNTVRKTKTLIILIVLIVLGVGGVFVWKNIIAPEEEGTQPIPESALKLEFGYGISGSRQMDLRYLQKDRNEWNPIGVMYERAHPGFANWQEIEPKRGQYSWEKTDEYVRGAQERNIQILFTIWPFTDWDQETCNLHLEWQKPELGKDPRVGFSPLAHRKGKPCDMEAYKEFLRRLVERYDGDGIADISGLRYPVRYWEIGNEPDVDFQGSDEDYFEILKASYTAIKEADPDAKILIAALPGMLGYLPGAKIPEWARPDFNPVELFELGAANYFDIMNLHACGGSRPVREFLEKYGAGDRPIWFTEPCSIKGFPRAETEEELALAFIQIFTEESKYGEATFFVGGPYYVIPALKRAIRYIKTGEFEPLEGEERVEKKAISGKCDCNALYDFYDTGPEMQGYAELIREDCNNACGFTGDIEKAGCYAILGLGLYDENGIWVGDCICRDMLTGKLRDYCYGYLTVVIHEGDFCDKIQDPDIKEWCMNPPP